MKSRTGPNALFYLTPEEARALDPMQADEAIRHGVQGSEVRIFSPRPMQTTYGRSRGRLSFIMSAECRA